MRVEGATHRAADGREVMKRFELLSIIGSMIAVGITLGAVVIGSVGNLRTEVQTLRTQVRTDITDVRTEMQSLRAEVNTEMQALRAEVNTEMQTLRTEVRTDIADVRTDIRALQHRLVAVERRQARTEGLLEGLRDAIMAQRGQEPPPAQKEST